eukprot:COSAG03_NODE_16451_length_401_cov_1.360927_2_plen_20_part_01
MLEPGVHYAEFTYSGYYELY